MLNTDVEHWTSLSKLNMASTDTSSEVIEHEIAENDINIANDTSVDASKDDHDKVANGATSSSLQVVSRSTQVDEFEQTSYPFQCNICNRRYKHRASLNNHKKYHSGDRRYKCHLCGKAFVTNSSLQNHMPVHTKIKAHMCEICGKSYTQRTVLLKHKKIHTGEKPYLCEVCPKAFVYKKNLDIHRLSHTNERNYSCEICKKRFKTSQAVKKHLQSAHILEKDHKCPVCRKAFVCERYLKRHVKAKHMTKIEKIKCEICEKWINSKKLILKHMQSHVDKQLVCDICGKSFPKFGQLNTHKKLHNADKPHKCPLCTKSFMAKLSLENHIRSHTGEKPFKCEKCPSSFTQRTSLTKHMKIHTGENKLPCEFCSKVCSSKFNYQRHMKTHVGENLTENLTIESEQLSDHHIDVSDLIVHHNGEIEAVSTIQSDHIENQITFTYYPAPCHSATKTTHIEPPNLSDAFEVLDFSHEEIVYEQPVSMVLSSQIETQGADVIISQL